MDTFLPKNFAILRYIKSIDTEFLPREGLSSIIFGLNTSILYIKQITSSGIQYNPAPGFVLFLPI